MCGAYSWGIAAQPKPTRTYMTKQKRGTTGRLAEPPSSDLDRIAEDLVARMQTPESKLGVKALFSSSPEELGRAAREAARSTRKRRS